MLWTMKSLTVGLGLSATLLAVIAAMTVLDEPTNAGGSSPVDSEERIIAAAAAAPTTQQAAFEDMSVGREEYVAAVDATRECTRAGGVNVLPAAWEGDRYSFDFGGGSYEQLQLDKIVYQRCFDEYLRAIVGGYNATQAIGKPPFSEETLATCLIREGVNLDGVGPRMKDMAFAVRDQSLDSTHVFQDCIAEQQ